MAKETSKIKLSLQNGDVAQTVVGTSIGVVTPFLLREYVDGYLPDGVPMIPAPWNKLSVIGSIGIGAACLIGGVVSKSLRMLLLPLGISSTSIGVMMGLFPTQSVPGGGLRLKQSPAGRGLLRSPQPQPNKNFQLRPAPPGVSSAGRGRVNVNNPGSNFTQKNPQERLAQLKKEALDIEAQKEVEKLEADNRFKKSQPSGAIPLRT